MWLGAYLRATVVLACLMLLVAYIWRQQQRQFLRVRTMFQYPFQTGDLIMSGSGRYVSAFTRAAFDHVGIVYRHPKTSQLLVWHTMQDIPGEWPMASFSPLQAFFNRVRNNCVIRPLIGGPSIQPYLTETFFRPFLQVRSRVDTGGFIRALRQGVANVLLLPDGLPDTTDRDLSREIKYLACVDLTVKTYVHCKVLSKRALRLGLIPEDFSSLLSADRLPLINQYQLGPEYKFQPL